MQTAFWSNSRTPHQIVSGDANADAALRSPFGEEVDEAIRQHAVEAFPEECCGIVVGGNYIRARNIHPNPIDYFEIDEAWLQTFATDSIQGYAHSHTRLMPWPTATDMQQQDLIDLPWAIASVYSDGDNPPFCADLFWFGDCLPMLPLLGRQFRPGIQDCYEVARDHYRSQGHDLPVMPREAEWWIADASKKKQNLFIDLLETSGFKIINQGDVKENDGFAVPYGTEVISHCGVFLPREKALHHLAGKLSTVEAAFKWMKRGIEGGKFFRLKES